MSFLTLPAFLLHHWDCVPTVKLPIHGSSNLQPPCRFIVFLLFPTVSCSNVSQTALHSFALYSAFGKLKWTWEVFWGVPSLPLNVRWMHSPTVSLVQWFTLWCCKERLMLALYWEKATWFETLGRVSYAVQADRPRNKDRRTRGKAQRRCARKEMSGEARVGSVKCATLMKCHDSPARRAPPTPAQCHCDKEDAAVTSTELSLPWRKVWTDLKWSPLIPREAEMLSWGALERCTRWNR